MKLSRQAVGCWHCGKHWCLVRAPCCWQRVQHSVKAHCDGEGTPLMETWTLVLAQADLPYSDDMEQTAWWTAWNKNALWRLCCEVADFTRVPSRPDRLQGFVPPNHLTSGFHWLDLPLCLNLWNKPALCLILTEHWQTEIKTSFRR